MSIRKAIYDLLNDSSTSVYPLVAPQELTDPYVVFSIRSEGVRTQSGVGPWTINVTLNIFANSLSACITLADTMYTGLEGVSGTYDTTEVLMVANFLSEDEGYIDDLNKYIITQEYQLYFT